MSFCVGILTKIPNGVVTGYGSGEIWLGGSDERSEGYWIWTDGSPGNIF